MPRTKSRQVTRTWILLLILTVVSMSAGHTGAGGLASSGIVLLAAVIKGRWMLMDFLKLRDVPPGWRIALSSWLVLIAAVAWIAAALPPMHG